MQKLQYVTVAISWQKAIRQLFFLKYELDGQYIDGWDTRWLRHATSSRLVFSRFCLINLFLSAYQDLFVGNRDSIGSRNPPIAVWLRSFFKAPLTKYK